MTRRALHDEKPGGAARGKLHEESLVLDPRVLLDPRFLGTLHRELRERLGESEAHGILLQTGFFHGMRDALRTLRRGEWAAGSETTAPVAPLLAMAFAADPPSPEGLVLHGTWPERLEAEAVAGSVGEVPEPGCLVSAGYTSGWLSGIFDCEMLALEESCAARAEPRCRFVAREAGDWRARRSERGGALLDRLPFAALRDLACQRLDEEETPDRHAAFDSRSPAIHVWGPVMVIPYAGEETASSVDLIASEPAAAEVSVVVLDVSSALIDEGFGAVALERTLEAVAAWGAEPVVAGVSPFSQAALAGLERPAPLVFKDLEEAIAAAFRIVESQRHPS